VPGITSVRVGERIYDVVEDRLSVYSVLLFGRIRDVVTNRGVRSPVRARATIGGIPLDVIAGANGFYCVSGYAERVFPDLANSQYSIELVVSALGYAERTRRINVLAGSTLPIKRDVEIRRLPVSVRGRVVKGTTATPDAVVSLLPASATRHPLAVRSGLHFDHSAGTPFRTRDVAPGATYTLDEDAWAGDSSVVLGSTANLQSGDVLLLDPPRATEFVILADFLGGGRVGLRAPLTRSFRDGTPAQLATFSQPAGAANVQGTLVDRPRRGDGVVVAQPQPSQTTAITASTVEIAAGTARREHQTLNVTSDPDGFYRLDNVAGVTVLRLQARSSAATPPTVVWTLDYDAAVNAVDLPTA
jgi:hypothetical protein